MAKSVLRLQKITRFTTILNATIITEFRQPHMTSHDAHFHGQNFKKPNFRSLNAKRFKDYRKLRDKRTISNATIGTEFRHSHDQRRCPFSCPEF